MTSRALVLFLLSHTLVFSLGCGSPHDARWVERKRAPGSERARPDGSAPVHGACAPRWVQEAYVQASNAGAHDFFGGSVSLSRDGSRLAVSAPAESSHARGVNGDASDDSARESGAVYVFVRSGPSWTQEAYLKASNADAGDRFGDSLSLSADGSRLAVGTPLESSHARGVNGDASDDSARESGAVYVFARSGSSWT